MQDEIARKIGDFLKDPKVSVLVKKVIPPTHSGETAAQAASSIKAAPAVAAHSAPRIVQLALGSTHTCARFESGEIACWGSGGSGQLGYKAPPFGQSVFPKRVPGVDHAVQLAAGEDTTCIITTTGIVKCVGTTTGMPSDQFQAVAGLQQATQVSIGGNARCARKASGTVVCWGSGYKETAGGNSDVPTPEAIPGLAKVTQVVWNGSHGCALSAGGGVACWGSNGSGQLGAGSIDDRMAPRPVAGLAHITQLAIGGSHTCTRDESGAVWCWGSNECGQLGIAHARPAGGLDGTEEVHAKPLVVPGLRNVVEIAAGKNFTCARTSDGAVRCWGQNSFGQLGDGTFEPEREVPGLVKGIAGALEIAAGEAHACARLGDGSVRCWGLNDSGQLGNGETESAHFPTAVRWP